MKVKIFLLVTLMIFLTLASVSAEDNATLDNTTDTSDDINVTFKEVMWKENLSDINVDMPQNASGTFCVKIDDTVIYNQTVTNKSFKVPITLPLKKLDYQISVFPSYDYKTYKVSAFFNNIDLKINKSLKIMQYSPEYNLLNFPSEVLQYSKHSVIMLFPRSADGEIEFYIDDKFFTKTTVRPLFYFEDDPFSKLNLSGHTLKVVYHGDSYYQPYNKTFNFNVTNVLISIPKTINISHDDCISVETLPDTVGNVKVYIDGVEIASSKTENGEYILSLEKYIKYTDSEIKVTYTCNDFTRTKTSLIHMVYDFDIWGGDFTYGENNIIEIISPDYLNNKLLTITINGSVYKFSRSKGIANNQVEVDISKLPAGFYVMNVSYAGDDKFYPLTRSYNFTVNYDFSIPYDIVYKDSSKIYIKLPVNAEGDLLVEVDGKYFISKRLQKGYAEISIDSLAPGGHEILAKYTGADYNVADKVTSISVAPEITLTYRFTAGEDKYINLKVPKATKGYVIFTVDGIPHKVIINNGIASFSLKKLKVGEHEINIDYYGAGGETDLDNLRVVTVYKPKIKFLTIKATPKSLTLKIKVLTKKSKPLANKKITIRFKGKTYNVKTNKKGILTLKKHLKLKKKKYLLKLDYMGFKVSKKVKIKGLS